MSITVNFSHLLFIRGQVLGTLLESTDSFPFEFGGSLSLGQVVAVCSLSEQQACYCNRMMYMSLNEHLQPPTGS